MAHVKDLRGRMAAVDEPQAGHGPAKRAAAWLQALGETLVSADAPEAKAELIHAIYERIVVAGPEFVRAHLTPAAHAHGLAALLPEVVVASPAGVGDVFTTTIPIGGRAEWLAVVAVAERAGLLTVTTRGDGKPVHALTHQDEQVAMAYADDMAALLEADVGSPTRSGHRASDARSRGLCR